MTTRSGRVVSAAANRPEDGEHDGDRDDPGEETVPEFDERMVFERGDELVLSQVGQSEQPRPEPVSRTAAR